MQGLRADGEGGHGLTVLALTSHAPALRYLRTSGLRIRLLRDGRHAVRIPAGAVYKIQERLHRRAAGACLKFDAKGRGSIAQCQAWPGPYEGECLEVPSGGPGHGGGRDSGIA